MTKLMDERCRALLADVLERTQGSMDGLNVQPFRVDHIDEIERLDSLIRKHLLVVDHAEETLRVGSMGLYFIESATRNTLLADIDRVLDFLREHYRQTFGKGGVRLADIATALDLGRNRVEECVAYINDAMALGLSTDPHDQDAQVFPTEPLLYFERFEEFLAERAGQWFPELVESKQAKAKPHGNTEVHAMKREQVLGAAITVILHWPEQCKRGDTFNGTRIATVIDQKARLWWAEGTPPLSIDSMARLINQHLKLPE